MKEQLRNNVQGLGNRKLTKEELLAGKCSADEPHMSEDNRLKSPDELINKLLKSKVKKATPPVVASQIDELSKTPQLEEYREPAMEARNTSKSDPKIDSISLGLGEAFGIKPTAFSPTQEPIPSTPIDAEKYFKKPILVKNNGEFINNTVIETDTSASESDSWIDPQSIPAYDNRQQTIVTEQTVILNPAVNFEEKMGSSSVEDTYGHFLKKPSFQDEIDLEQSFGEEAQTPSLTPLEEELDPRIKSPNDLLISRAVQSIPTDSVQLQAVTKELDDLKNLHDRKMKQWLEYNQRVHQWKEQVLKTIASIKKDLSEAHGLKNQVQELKKELRVRDEALEHLQAMSGKPSTKMDFLFKLLRKDQI
jgi:hypothetical protein